MTVNFFELRVTKAACSDYMLHTSQINVMTSNYKGKSPFRLDSLLKEKKTYDFKLSVQKSTWIYRNPSPACQHRQRQGEELREWFARQNPWCPLCRMINVSSQFVLLSVSESPLAYCSYMLIPTCRRYDRHPPTSLNHPFSLVAATPNWISGCSGGADPGYSQLSPCQPFPGSKFTNCRICCTTTNS